MQHFLDAHPALRGLPRQRSLHRFYRTRGIDRALIDDKVVFYVENQGCCTWATDETGDDPPVFARRSDAWVVECSSLSAFLIEILILEAVLSAPWSAEHPSLSLEALAKVQKKLPPFPLPEWPDSGAQFFGSEGVIGVAIEGGIGFETAGPTERFVRLGSCDRTCFEPLETLIRNWPEVCV